MDLFSGPVITDCMFLGLENVWVFDGVAPFITILPFINSSKTEAAFPSSGYVYEKKIRCLR